MGRPSKLERETIITFNEEEDTASVFTYSARWQRVLAQRCKGELEFENPYGGKSFKINKRYVRVPLPTRGSGQ